VTTGIPADTGAVVIASCETGYNLTGSTELTCVKGTTFTAVEDPSCVIGKSNSTAVI